MTDSVPRLLTIGQFSQRHPAFSQAGLRWIRFNEETNGFSPAFLNVNSRVLIDEDRFFQIILEKNSTTDQG